MGEGRRRGAIEQLVAGVRGGEGWQGGGDDGALCAASRRGVRGARPLA